MDHEKENEKREDVKSRNNGGKKIWFCVWNCNQGEMIQLPPPLSVQKTLQGVRMIHIKGQPTLN